MSYELIETSDYLGHPVELCRFSRNTEVYTYTSADHAITHNGEIYDPSLPIKMSKPKISNNGGSESITLTVPRDHPVAVRYRLYVPGTGMAVTLFMGHVGDNDFIVGWQGRIIQVDWDNDGQALIKCESVRATMKRGGLPYRFGPLCQHAVYRGGCGLSIPAHSVDITIVTAVDNVIESPDLVALTDGEYLGGLVTFDTYDFRTIIVDSGDSITINRPFEGVVAGDILRISKGCDKTVARCKALGNFENYFAFNTIPTENPFETGLE